MDGLPLELVRLCALASLAECGDHLWDSVPALGRRAARWLPGRQLRPGRPEAALDVFRDLSAAELSLAR
jgi:hypothetical protein